MTGAFCRLWKTFNTWPCLVVCVSSCNTCLYGVIREFWSFKGKVINWTRNLYSFWYKNINVDFIAEHFISLMFFHQMFVILVMLKTIKSFLISAKEQVRTCLSVFSLYNWTLWTESLLAQLNNQTIVLF